MRDAVRSLWAEPRVPDAPARVWRDGVLFALLVPTAILEAALRPDVVWRPVALVLALLVIFALPWRRTRPLGAVVVAFVPIIVVDLFAIPLAEGPIGLYTTAIVLVFPYALFRWGSGREAAIGLAIMLVTLVLGTIADYTGIGEAIAGGLILLFPAELGAVVRYRSAVRLREIDQVKLKEREQLARELHDTVAHHVSAIAIQAQAGRALAAADPDAAVEALAVIEEEASRTLVELRAMVGGLRQGDQPELSPQLGVADIDRLAATNGAGPTVDVELTGNLIGLRPSVDAALYRLAQESITNAMRHARRATRIAVRVAGERDVVRLTVVDDGDGGTSASGDPLGYGLVGMTERAKLLGGSVEAGPGPGRGWTVNAVLPRHGSAS